MEKEVDLLKILRDTAKVAEFDSMKAAGKKEAYEEVAKYIESEKLKVFKEEPDEEVEATDKE